MNHDFDDQNALWRRCEREWGSWLHSMQWTVVHLTNAIGNAAHTQAPLIETPDGFVRAPDLLASKAGVNEYWEVKFRSSAQYNELTGEREHWMPRQNVQDYYRVSQSTGSRVRIILYEASANNGQGQWFQIEVDELIAVGRNERRTAGDLSEIDAWIWPRSAMDSVAGPHIQFDLHEAPVLPDEGNNPPVAAAILAPIERNLRRRNSPEKATTSGVQEAENFGPEIQKVMEAENEIGLKILCDSMGIKNIPHYSVLRIGNKNTDLSDLLGLLHYGIRLFLITPTAENDFNPEDLQAFTDSRLIEWAVIPESEGLDTWVIDGVNYEFIDLESKNIIDKAENLGLINFKQYKIIHAAQESDIIVHAGAGTGKTETMSERVVFLLATTEKQQNEQGISKPVDLRLDDIVLVTFTREASRQMRERLAKTLTLRKRLSRRCVLPAVAWMMQLSTTEISTIHSFAKTISKQGAGMLGISPEFRVSKQTMQFRDELFRELSKPLESLYQNGKFVDVPAVHEWRELLETIWEKLDNNGVELMSLIPGKKAQIDWPNPEPGSPDEKIAAVVVQVLELLGARFAEVCIDNQAIPTSKLVSTALAAITSQEDPPIRKPKFLFIDEFQDTDTEQMDLIVKIRKVLGSQLFVVGDVKQGIYRFRGAEGSAFLELRKRISTEKLPAPISFPLTRNFRSGKTLLNSLHQFFNSWGNAGLLEYSDSDQLEPDIAKSKIGSAFEPEIVTKANYKQKTIAQVQNWLEAAKANKKKIEVAVLCRNNWTAIEMQRELINANIPCELVVGGDFYRTPAVREMRVLLEVLANPNDNAAVLELCETRWAEGLMTSIAPEGTLNDDLQIWSQPVGEIMSWQSRFSTLSGGNFIVSDLDPLRQRIASLRNILEKIPLLSLIMLCSQHFAPANCALPIQNDDIERARYARCFDHLLMQIDQEFGDTSMTLPRLLQWLRIQIATNFNEDEPFEQQDLVGKVTALTVHKSKGLEFDHVIVPYTWEKFVKSYQPIKIVIDSAINGTPRIIWRWKPAGSNQISNTTFTDTAWAAEEHQVQKEETRLLYVAMTRAKENLVVFVRTDNPIDTPDLDAAKTWGELLRKVSGI